VNAQQQAQVISLYDRGATLEQIGRPLGVTRERARQLVDELARDGAIVKRSRVERKYEAAFPEHACEVETLFLKLRDDGAVARRTGIEAGLVRRFVDETVPDPDVLRRKHKTGSERCSDEELIGCLRLAAHELAAPMAYDAYTEWSRGRMLDATRPWPGPQGMILRFGCWRTVLTRAGLPAHATAGPDARFALADAVNAMVLAWRDIARPPTIGEYDAWRAGRDEFPVSATARKWVDGWDALQLLAWPIVHGRTLPDSASREP
jgi:hypothetical protein